MYCSSGTCWDLYAICTSIVEGSTDLTPKVIIYNHGTEINTIYMDMVSNLPGVKKVSIVIGIAQKELVATLFSETKI